MSLPKFETWKAFRWTTPLLRAAVAEASKRRWPSEDDIMRISGLILASPERSMARQMCASIVTPALMMDPD